MTATAMPLTAASEPIHTLMPVDLIDISKTNPRKHFDKDKLAELGESIVRHGIIVPLLVRPITGERFELVAGERRLRAAREIAALTEVPVIVRQLTDKDALEMQVIENLQREDLHVLEEAEGYATLIKKHGYDADTLAEKIGKSRSYVYGRMKLADLNAPAKKALWEEKITHSVALLIARIADANLQTEALKVVAGDHPMSYRRASEYIQQNFMLRLDQAPFDRADAQLVAAAGACVTCPYRTGNQSELFDDVKSADVCTKPSCYNSKVNAWLTIEAKEKGWKAMPAAQAEKNFSWSGNLSYDSKYVDIDEKTGYTAGAKKYRDHLDDDAPIVLARDPKGGKIHQLILKSKLPAKFQPRADTAAPRQHDDTKWKRDRELRTATEGALRAALAKKITKSTNLAEVFPGIAAAIAVERQWSIDEIVKELELQPLKLKRGVTDDKAGTVTDYVRELKPHQRILLVAALLFVDDDGTYNDAEDLAPARKYFFTSIGVDAEAIVTKVKTELEAKWVRAKPTKKAKARR